MTTVEWRRRAQVAALGLVACSPASNSPRSPAPTLVIENVTVVDVGSGQLLAHMDVVIEGQRISRVEHHVGDRNQPAGRTINGRGKFLIPGLWDMHVHALWAGDALTTFLPLFVSQGITGVRDMGGSLELLRAARDSIAEGAWYPSVVGPGPVVDGPEPVQQEISVAIGDSARAGPVIDSLADGGANFIKVYTMLPRAAFLAVLTAARRRNLTVVGHVPADVTPEDAARLGMRSIEHLRDEIEPFCTRVTANQCSTQLAAFKQYDVWQVPTLHALRMKSVLDDTTLAHDPRLAYLMPSIRQEWLSTQASRLARGAAYFQGKRDRVENEIWLTGLIFRDQGHVLAGTDAGVAFSYPGFSLHDELVLLVESGLSPLDALRAATIEPARFLGIEDTVGAIRPGQRADLVLLREDPVNNIAATRSIEAVVLRGQLLDRPGLDSLLLSVEQAADAQ
jgi:imidazolonepropionase-like amidohydrolase